LSGRDARGRDFVMGVYAMLRDETCCLPVSGNVPPLQ
jgi:hypothetical protein